MSKKTKTPKTTTKAKDFKMTSEKEVIKKTKPVVDADAMAAAVKSTTGNDYQQYIRNLFKDKLNRK